MALPVTAILSNQGYLWAKAHLFTGDLNEASLLVGKVVSRAFDRFDEEDSAETIKAALKSDLDSLIRQAS